MYFTWVIRSDPAMIAAKLVVSERGEILSPKYAPDMIAPATQPSWIPKERPIPIKANPIVAIVVQELPVINETIVQVMVHDSNKK